MKAEHLHATVDILGAYASDVGEEFLWFLKFSTKKVVFLVSSGKYQISPLMATLLKNLGNIP